MSEKVNDRTVFSLLEVTKSIQKTLADRYKGSYWIKAEMNKLNFYNHSGHCYPELVEKQDGKIIAMHRRMADGSYEIYKPKLKYEIPITWDSKS